MTEVLNDHWQEWRKLLDFCHARVLKSANTLEEMDVAFVEGAIASDKQVRELKEIRRLAKKLVAVGACAVMGMPSAQRNYFNEHQRKQIEFLLARFSALPKVLKVAEVVPVDVEIPGCPMDPHDFLSKVNALVKDFQEGKL